MASRSLGTLRLDVVAKIGGFTAGLDKAEKEAKKRAAAIEKAFDGAAVAAGVAFGAMAVAATAAFAAIGQGIEEAAKFQDLSEMTGAAAEDLAGLSVAAATAGVSIEDVAGSMIKLTKNMEDVDKKGNETAQALKNIGISVADFKKLDPVGQYEAISKALAGFADGAGKTSTALALFGKSGAEQLKVMKALEEQGGRTNILTKEQILLADEYADKQAKARAQLSLYASALSTEAIPAITATTNAVTGLIKELVAGNKAQSDFALNLTILDWAEKLAVAIGTVAEAVIGLGKTLRAVGGSFESVFADAKVLEGLTPTGAVRNALNGTSIQSLLDNREKVAREANERYKNLWTYDGKQITTAIKKSFADQKATIKNLQDPEIRRLMARSNAQTNPGLPVLPVTSVGGGGGRKSGGGAAKDPFAEANRYIESLQKQLEKTQELTVAEQALQDIQMGRLGQVSSAQKDQILSLASQIDAAKELKKQEEQTKKYKEALVDVNSRLAEMRGLTSEAVAIKFDRDNSALYKLFSEQGDEEAKKKLDLIKQMTVAAAQFAEQQDKLGKVQTELQRKEERIQRDAEMGLTGQMEALNKLGEARKSALEGMKSSLAELQAIQASGTELTARQKDQIADLTNQIESLSSRLDPLGEKFNGIFSDAASNAFGDFISGAKSAKDAFKDFTTSVMNEITRMVAQDLAKKFFGSVLGGGGNSGGVGGLLSSLFGSSTSGGGFSFASGGYTGDGAANDPAGIVHKGEYVIDAQTTRAIGVDNIKRGNFGGGQVNNFMFEGRVDRRTQDQIAQKTRQTQLSSATRFRG